MNVSQNRAGKYIVYLLVVAYLMFLLAQKQFSLFGLFVVLALLVGMLMPQLLPSYAHLFEDSVAMCVAFAITFFLYWYFVRLSRESFQAEAATEEETSVVDGAGADEEDDDDDDDDDDEGESKGGNIDMSKTFLEAYQNLSPDQVTSMTNETQRLISTQKQLMETLKSLSPVVKQGKELMDGFKTQFGNDPEFLQTMKALLPKPKKDKKKKK